MWTAIVLALAALSVPDELTVSASRAAAPAGLTFRAGFAVESNGTWASEFYTRDVTEGPSEWIVRRSLMTPEGPEQVRWLTDCPVAAEVADSMNRLDLGSFELPYVNRIGPRLFLHGALAPPATESARYVIWGTGAQGGGSVDYRLSVASGALADWAKAAAEALNQCPSEASRAE